MEIIPVEKEIINNDEVNKGALAINKKIPANDMYDLKEKAEQEDFNLKVENIYISFSKNKEGLPEDIIKVNLDFTHNRSISIDSVITENRFIDAPFSEHRKLYLRFYYLFKLSEDNIYVYKENVLKDFKDKNIVIHGLITLEGLCDLMSSEIMVNGDFKLNYICDGIHNSIKDDALKDYVLKIKEAEIIGLELSNYEMINNPRGKKPCLSLRNLTILVMTKKTLFGIFLLSLVWFFHFH